jgi:hypothetical protein
VAWAQPEAQAAAVSAQPEAEAGAAQAQPAAEGAALEAEAEAEALESEAAPVQQLVRALVTSTELASRLQRHRRPPG